MSALNTLIKRDNELDKSGEEMGRFKAYSPELPIKEITGTRIVKCQYRYKEGEDLTGKPTNSYVRIPDKHITEEKVIDNIATLAPYVVSYLQEIEDKLIKEEHKRGGLFIYTDKLSLNNIISYLEEAGSGGRLNKEKIEAWFASDIEENLMMLIIDKMGIMDSINDISETQEAKIHLIASAYKKKFVSLASPKTILSDEDREALINVIKKCEADKSILGARFIAKIENMKQAESDLLMEL